ncbi:MAG: chemotaxis protein CheA [Anaerovoracaceae bacterium]
MTKGYSNEPMLDIFIYETEQNLEQLEISILSSERKKKITNDAINEIFRVMHTIKGSAAMMMFDNIASLAHAIEDLFFYIREEKPKGLDPVDIYDLVLTGIDVFKSEIEMLKQGREPEADHGELIESIHAYLSVIKGEGAPPASIETAVAPPASDHYYLTPIQTEPVDGCTAYEALLYFDEDCSMENVRAFAIVHSLKDIASQCCHYPENLIDDSTSAEIIREQGFVIQIHTEMAYKELFDYFAASSYVRAVDLKEMALCGNGEEPGAVARTADAGTVEDATPASDDSRSSHQSIISVDVAKLDRLMELMGEMVIAEAMVTQNPEVAGLEIDSFQKSARQLQKITVELQDVAMSIRMVPLSTTFHKMHRIVRDMTKKLDKEAELVLVGETTEVDKNIIEHISDPLMHLVRNAVDHGIERPEERIRNGKDGRGRVTLEAENVGGDVLIVIRDDGRGLNRDEIYKKALKQKLISPDAELTDREVMNLVFAPGFSTNEAVTEFSGRGVGMDVVVKNLEAVGGTISIESTPGQGTATIMKIPLTLAIIDGMNIRVGEAIYTLPTISIKETFRANVSSIVVDPSGNELIQVRGDWFSILRLHEKFDVEPDSRNLEDGIVIMVEQDEKYICLFADELLGQQQVVVKPLPLYIRQFKNIASLTGCTLLGDGSMSLILNVIGLIGSDGRIRRDES